MRIVSICDANRVLHQTHIHHASFLDLSSANRVSLLRFHFSVGSGQSQLASSRKKTSTAVASIHPSISTPPIVTSISPGDASLSVSHALSDADFEDSYATAAHEISIYGTWSYRQQNYPLLTVFIYLFSSPTAIIFSVEPTPTIESVESERASSPTVRNPISPVSALASLLSSLWLSISTHRTCSVMTVIVSVGIASRDPSASWLAAI